MIQFRHKEVYGKSLYYPYSKKALALTNLAKQKSLTHSQVNDLKKEFEIFILHDVFEKQN